MRTLIATCIHMWSLWTHTHTHTHSNTHTYTHTYTHARTHTHTHTDYIENLLYTGSWVNCPAGTRTLHTPAIIKYTQNMHTEYAHKLGTLQHKILLVNILLYYVMHGMLMLES